MSEIQEVISRCFTPAVVMASLYDCTGSIGVFAVELIRHSRVASL